jgi:hypothetical protein
MIGLTTESDRALQWPTPEREEPYGQARRWEMKVLDSGRCEPLKAAVHSVVLAAVSVCAAYNAAAWLRRRQRHLAINAVIYSAAILWERCHIVHHLSACSDVVTEPEPPVQGLSKAA